MTEPRPFPTTAEEYARVLGTEARPVAVWNAVESTQSSDGWTWDFDLPRNWRPIQAHQSGECRHGNHCHTCGQKLARANLACHYNPGVREVEPGLYASNAQPHSPICYPCIRGTRPT